MKDEIEQLPADLRKVADLYADSVFHSACVAGELALVTALVDLGVAPDAYPGTEDEDDEPPLTWIARYRDQTSSVALHVAQFLIGRGAGVDEGTPLLAALVAEDVSLALMLLAAGADPELDEDDLGDREAALLNALLETGWSARANPNTTYFVALLDGEEIAGVGLVEGEALASAEAAQEALTAMPASGRLVARYLSGEEFSWTGEDLADLDEESEE